MRMCIYIYICMYMYMNINIYMQILNTLLYVVADFPIRVPYVLTFPQVFTHFTIVSDLLRSAGLV